jgi:hypothetical protein
MSEEKKIIPLKYPITVSKEGGTTVEITELIIGRIKLRHLKSLPDDFMESGGKISPKSLIPLIAGMANISEESAGEIDMEDLAEVTTSLTSFLSASPQIGEKQ